LSITLLNFFAHLSYLVFDNKDETMAGGPKKPVNIFRLRNLNEPKEVFNWRLWFAVLSFGLMGAARGVDEGECVGDGADRFCRWCSLVSSHFFSFG
jgi:hypothetical protein